MATLNAGRVGYIRGTPGSNYTNAKTNNGSIAYDSETTSAGSAIMAFFSSGRGGGTYLFHRTYIYFDTSGITGTVTSATLKITGTSFNSANVVVADGGNAFGGDGNTALATTDFNAVDIGAPPTLYSSLTSWSTSLNSITLNPGGRSALSSNNDTVLCVLNGDHDYQTNAQTSTVTSGIAFGTAIQIEYTVAASSNITSLNGIAKASITNVNTIALGSITSINGVS